MKKTTYFILVSSIYTILTGCYNSYEPIKERGQIERPINHVLVTYDENITLKENQKINIVLKTNNIDDDNLTYHIITKPKYGKLIGNDKNITYIPNKIYHKKDGFTFQISDGEEKSNISDINLTILGFRIINKKTFYNENAQQDITYRYNEHGDMTYNQDDVFETKYDYIYNENNTTIMKSVFKSNIKYRDKTTTIDKYDDNGTLISKFVDYGSGTYELVYTYDKNGNITVVKRKNNEDNFYRTVRNYTYTYDKNGNILEKKEDIAMPSGEVNGNIDVSTTYTYDENNVVISEKMSTHMDGYYGHDYKFKYTYDENENILTKEYFIHEGNDLYMRETNKWIEL